MEIKVHYAEPDNGINDIFAFERLEFKDLLLVYVQLIVSGNEVVGSKQKATGAAGGVADDHIWPGSHNFDDGLD